MAFLRKSILAAIVLLATAIAIGGMIDSVPGPIVEFFQYAFLLLFWSAAWAARALADVRLILFGTLALLVLFYILTRPQPDAH